MKRFAAMAALSGLLLLIPLSETHADCERGKRLNHSNADCLTAQQWETSRFFSRKSHAKAKNLCPKWGRVIAKVDIKNGTDGTWGLTNGNWREESWRFPKRVREVSCCSDLSDLCSKSDVLTTRGCETQFNRSEANRTCDQKVFAVRGENCVVEANCKRNDESVRRASITAHYPDTKTIKNCDGTMKLGARHADRKHRRPDSELLGRTGDTPNPRHPRTVREQTDIDVTGETAGETES